MVAQCVANSRSKVRFSEMTGSTLSATCLYYFVAVQFGKVIPPGSLQYHIYKMSFHWVIKIPFTYCERKMKSY
jgi:hypothetical protein